MGQIWFISDLHLGHERILKFQDRGYSDINKHDEMIIKYWNETVGKKDTIYILGDLCLKTTEDTRKVLERLNGNKILIEGNHDSSSVRNSNYFGSVKKIYNITFKKSTYNYLDNNFKLCMCHYPILSWEGRDGGVCMIHGHCHGKIDSFNNSSKELRVDVGYDGNLSKGKFITLQQLYNYFKKIAKTSNFKEYMQNSNLIDIRNEED
jgi:calcineurin-like phosphoesterase family protein